MQLEIGAVFEGKVTGITKYGAFVEFLEGQTGMVHISEIAGSFVKEIRDHIKENDQVRVKIISINDDGKISLSIKQAKIPFVKKPAAKSPGRPGGYEWSSSKKSGLSFEDMMLKFKQSSEEKISDLRRGDRHDSPKKR